MMRPYSTDLQLTSSSEERSFASRVVVHVTASALLSMHKMTSFSSLIRNEGKTGEQKGLSDTRNSEKNPMKMDVAMA